METIKEFLYKLGNEYIYLTLISIIALVIIIFFSIVLHVSKKRARAEKTKAQFKQSSLQSLTPEEIDNISNNSANPEEVKEYLTQEVVPTEEEKAEKPKQTKKPATKTKKAQVKKEVKSEEKPTKANAKKVENPTETKKAEVKKAEPKKTQKVVEVKNTEKATQTKKVEKPKTTAPKKVEPVKEPEKRKYTGKWKISQESDGYTATLSASNGGTLLKTEKYKSLSGVKNGIETIKRNIDGGNFAISVDKYGHYRFKLFNLSNRLICVSEDYSSKNKCENGIESVKRFAKTDVVIMEEK